MVGTVAARTAFDVGAPPVGQAEEDVVETQQVPERRPPVVDVGIGENLIGAAERGLGEMCADAWRWQHRQAG